MKRKALALTLVLALLFSAVAATQFVNLVYAQSFEIITIKADGTIEPFTAPIQRWGHIYTLTANINGSISVETSNIVIDGAGYTLQGNRSGTGIDLKGSSAVRITNVEIKTFNIGIAVNGGSDNVIIENNIRDTGYGVKVGWYALRNIISANNITNNWHGIDIAPDADYNNVSWNNISNNAWGIKVQGVVYNRFFGNIIANNERGITFSFIAPEGINNRVYHNNFVNNTMWHACLPWNAIQYADWAIWDDGFPSGGNYWSDYGDRYPSAEELNASGLWDTPYVIDQRNRDNYPFMFHLGAPVVSLVSPGNMVYVGSNVSLAFNLSKPVVWLGYSLDGQENVTIYGNTSLVGLASGLHTVTVYARDAFENVGASETTIFTIEEPFPTALVAVASVAIIAVVGVGLLVYFKKRKR